MDPPTVPIQREFGNKGSTRATISIYGEEAPFALEYLFVKRDCCCCLRVIEMM